MLPKTQSNKQQYNPSPITWHYCSKNTTCGWAEYRSSHTDNFIPWNWHYKPSMFFNQGGKPEKHSLFIFLQFICH